MSSCCHYDEGWDDGYEQAKRDGAGVTEVVDVLDQLARELVGERADLVREIAATVARDQGLAERAKKFQEQQVTLLSEERKKRQAKAA